MEEGAAVDLDGTFFHAGPPAVAEIIEGADVEQVDLADDQVVFAGTDLFDGFCNDGFLPAAGFAVHGQAAAAFFQGSDNGSDLFGTTEDAVAGCYLVKGKGKDHANDSKKPAVGPVSAKALQN